MVAMKKNHDARYGVAPLRAETIEHVLVPAGRKTLTLQQLEKRCVPRLTRLFADHAVWAPDGYGDSWRIGDFSILIVETTVAKNADLYVQFWAEPCQPVDCEVSSGNPNPPAKKFITPETHRQLREMGFKIGGSARNFAKQLRIGNTGDARATAGEVVRIFHDALGYRGRTPLVARLVTSQRSSRAVVHHSFTQDDVVTFLTHQGCDACLAKEGRRPIIHARCDDFNFAVLPAAPAAERGRFVCVDFVALVASSTDESRARWVATINELNGASRVARVWMDEEGDVLVGTSLSLFGGATDDSLAAAVSGWLATARELAGGPPRSGKRKKGRAPRELVDDEPATQAGRVVH